MRHGHRSEKLATLFLAVFSTGLTAVLANDGMITAAQWPGAFAAVLGSLSAAALVRVWPQPAKARARSK
jgi:hypothetical protein